MNSHDRFVEQLRAALSGEDLTTELIRQRWQRSLASAKRDLRKINALLDDGILCTALEFADGSACAAIETCCAWTWAPGQRWYHLDVVDEVDMEYVQKAKTYLAARGLLIRHPTDSRLVRFAHTDEAQPSVPEASRLTTPKAAP